MQSSASSYGKRVWPRFTTLSEGTHLRSDLWTKKSESKIFMAANITQTEKSMRYYSRIACSVLSEPWQVRFHVGSHLRSIPSEYTLATCDYFWALNKMETIYYWTQNGKEQTNEFRWDRHTRGKRRIQRLFQLCSHSSLVVATFAYRKSCESFLTLI